jgi:hypothetical protein
MPTEQEKRAIDLVIKYEKQNGRKAIDYSSQHCIYDVKSSGRLIEVKSRVGNGVGFSILQNTIDKLSSVQKKQFYLYYVELRDKPTIRIVPPNILFKNLIPDTKYRLPARIISAQKPEKL